MTGHRLRSPPDGFVRIISGDGGRFCLPVIDGTKHRIRTQCIDRQGRLPPLTAANGLA
jgi:hypothetical protein